ncbi:M28 family metallopeptidase [Sphingomonas montanisoli]|uniref:M28 family peptidase n=1 Tax=Sphingomonas montanisoli TaxID=2606412 RepID=A0A5D9C7S5_9SPHN|nr:M28 family metallopeptidase [Sphingomonas montanisoli]TZG27456.1 M28 family peptidase [Sphingomonas montanisoli]
MTKTSRIIALMLAGLPVAAIAALPAPAFDTARVSQDIKTLSSDAYEGRGPATPGETKAVAYIVDQMQKAGLKPGGPIVNGQRTWTQDVPLLMSDITGSPKLSMNLAGTAKPLTQGTEIAVRAAMTGQNGVSIKDVPLVFVGYGVKAPERNWDDFKGVDLRGKILVLFVNDPDFEGGEGDFGGKAMTYYGRWTYKYEEAARQGAAGVLVIHEYEPASYGWATVKNSNTNTMFDIVRQDPRASHTQMEGWIQKDLAAQLFKASGLDFDAMKKAAQRRDFKPVPLKATMSADYQVAAKTIVSKNVLGRIDGKTHPDETVVYSGHWDHLGVGQPDAKGDTIYNGALDNASGIAALLELARVWAKEPQPDRSVAFLAVTAEEKGLLGSEFYAANPVYPLGTTVGVLNMDGPFGWSKTKDVTISGNAKLGLLDMLVADAAKQGRRFTSDSKPEAGHFYRSDHFPFAKRGVPAISYSAGNDLVNGGVERGKALDEAYTKDRYHQPADEWSADWDSSSVPDDLGLLYNLGRELADSRLWPDWSADSEFKAARDQSKAERK